jgi:hypothetical protein
VIKSDDQLKIAQEAVRNLQQVLLAARRVHTEAEYRAMSEPILLEIQQREQAILDYLSRADSATADHASPSS